MRGCRAAWYGLLSLLVFSLHGLSAEPLDRTLQSEQPRLRVAWLSNLYPEHSFWQQNLRFTQAVAEDLGIQLSSYFLYQDQLNYRKLLAQLGQGESGRIAVDGVLFGNLKQQSQALLTALEQGAKPGISSILPLDQQRVGKPREQFSQWIGEIQVDERQNGYQLAQRLLDEARSKQLYARDGKLHIVAIAGNQADSVGMLREQGLKQALAKHTDVVLHHLFHAHNWSRDEGRLFARTALRRYPQTTVIWSANDDIAFGVIKAARELHRQPGKNLLTGGVDGTIEMLRHVAAGEAVCTVSGLFMNSGWALILLYDYLSGVDFNEEPGVVFTVHDVLVDQPLAQQYLDKFAGGNWQRIDFTRFSKALNPALTHYNFSVQAILEQ